MAKFDLGDYLKTVAVPNSGTAAPEQLLQLPLSQLREDARNFYSVEGVENLAANIQLCGLMDPLRVRREGDVYIIVSGHRRFAALKLLAQEDERFSFVSCILEPEGTSSAMQELRLIYANSDTRRMSSYDIGKQAQRVQTLLYELKEAGVEFPGRMRDHVAEACKISKSKLSRLAAIEAHLLPSIREKYWTGAEKTDLSESTAYALSQLPESLQNLVIDAYVRKEGIVMRWLPAGSVEKIREAVSEAEKVKCPVAAVCANTSRRAGHIIRAIVAHPYERPACASHCCATCPKLTSCGDACPLQAPKKRGLLAAARGEKRRDAEEKAARERPAVERVSTLWHRFGQLRQKAGLSGEDFLKAIDAPYAKASSEMRQLETGDTLLFTPNTELPYGCGCTLSVVDRWLKSAELLGCSVDYLMGRTDDPRTIEQAAHPLAGQQMMLAGWMPGGTNPAHDCEAVAMVLLDDGLPPMRVGLSWSSGAWRYGSSPGAPAVTDEILAWLEIPAWPGEGGGS